MIWEEYGYRLEGYFSLFKYPLFVPQMSIYPLKCPFNPLRCPSAVYSDLSQYIEVNSISVKRLKHPLGVVLAIYTKCGK